MNKILTAVSVLVLTGIAINTQAQERVKVLSYNVLNFPNPDFVDHRADTLRKIIDYYTPDIFLMQELKSESGMLELLDVAFNHSGTEYFAAGTWVPQISNPGSSWLLQQNVIYNTDRLTLIEESYLLTGHRDLNIFKFLVNDENLEVHQDSTFFYTISWHLKSSQGAENAQQRAQMAQVLVDHFDDMDPNASVLIAGDYNIYSSSEAAYQLLLNAGNAIQLQDPIDAPGSWHDNASFSYLHTQSTRTSQINGDGAGGGMDDRFDIILASANMFDPQGSIRYVDESYEAMGNTGNCFNQRLIDCTGGSIPSDVVYAMYQMSDHLPVKMELDVYLPEITGVSNIDKLASMVGSNLVRDRLEIQLPLETKGTYTVRDISGSTVSQGNMNASKFISIPVGHLAQGLYLLHIDSGIYRPFKFVKMN